MGERGDGAPRDDLRQDGEPHVNVDRVEAVEEGLLDEWLATVAEPEGEEAQLVLDRVGRAQRDRPEEALRRRWRRQRREARGASGRRGIEAKHASTSHAAHKHTSTQAHKHTSTKHTHTRTKHTSTSQARPL